MINVTKPVLPSFRKYTKYLDRIWKDSQLTNNGEYVQLLERRLKEYLEVKYLLLVANGTLGLLLALKALDLRDKDEVITTPFTFAATTNAIIWQGLIPVFADIDPETFNINPRWVEKKITNKTRAIVAVHLYGNPCYVEKLQRIANKHGLKLIYDSAHAFGVEYKNQSVLNYGDISVLSFHATKTFHTIEGGAVVVKSKKLYEKLKLLRNHGIASEKKVVLAGLNAKMNEFQAAMGLCNLEEIDEKNRLRNKIYEHYKAKLTDTTIKFQKIIASRYNYIYMPVCFKSNKEKTKIYSELIKNGICPREDYPSLTANFGYFKEKGLNLVEKGGLNVASDIADRILCLPLYPDLKIGIVNNIISIIKNLTKL